MNPIEAALANRPKWMDDGICAQTDPEAFYPEVGNSTLPAKLICMRCPVVEECLAYALQNHERYGVWGGLSERERRRIERNPAQIRPQDDPVLIAEVLELAATGMSQHQIAREVGATRWAVTQIIITAGKEVAA